MPVYECGVIAISSAFTASLTLRVLMNSWIVSSVIVLLVRVRALSAS